jgi:hypothetical protein
VRSSPMLPAKQSTETGAERISLGLIWVSLIDRRTIRGGQFRGLSIGQRAMDCSGRDAVDMVAIHETDAVGSRDYDAVEQVQIGYLQNMLDRSELFAAAGQHRRLDSKGCVGDRFFSAHPLRLGPPTSQHRRNQFTALMPPARPRAIMKNSTTRRVACLPLAHAPTELRVVVLLGRPWSPSRGHRDCRARFVETAMIANHSSADSVGCWLSARRRADAARYSPLPANYTILRGARSRPQMIQLVHIAKPRDAIGSHLCGQVRATVRPQIATAKKKKTRTASGHEGRLLGSIHTLLPGHPSRVC